MLAPLRSLKTGISLESRFMFRLSFPFPIFGNESVSDLFSVRNVPIRPETGPYGPKPGRNKSVSEAVFPKQLREIVPETGRHALKSKLSQQG